MSVQNRAPVARLLSSHAREQSDIMTLAHQFFGEVGNDAFSATVKKRRDPLVKWGYLRNPHSVYVWAT